MRIETNLTALVLFLSCSVWAGCAEGRRRGASIERTDSAGVHIVSNGAQEHELTWTFVERFRLGGREEGPEAFFRVNERLVGVDERGHIVILDPDNYCVVQFDSQGRFLRAFGGRGGGPGEFEFPARVAVDPGGSVAVYHAMKRGLVLFDPEGRPTGQVSLAHLGVVRGVSIRGDSIIFGFRSSPGDDGTRSIELRVAFHSDTSTLASLAEPPATSQFYESCAVSISLPPLFAKPLVWRHIGTIIAFSAQPAYVIEILSPGRRLSIRRLVNLLDATPDVAARELGDGMEIQIGVSRTCLIPTDDVIRQRGIASAVPAVRDLAVAPDGSVWVKRWRFEDQAPKVDVFQPDGAYTGTLSGDYPFPIGFLPNGDVLAAESDSFDVQQLVVFGVNTG